MPTASASTITTSGDRLCGEFDGFGGVADDLAMTLAPDARDAFTEVVGYEADAGANLYRLYHAVALNHDLAASGANATANGEADFCRPLSSAMANWHTGTTALTGGKWDHMMDQTHIGYAGWQQPDKQIMPPVTHVSPSARAHTGCMTAPSIGPVTGRRICG